MTISNALDKRLLDKQNKSKSVLEMKRIHSGSVTGIGIIVGTSETYVVISRTQWQCSNTECMLMHDEHHNPPVPNIIAPFDSGNGKPLFCPKCKHGGFEVEFETNNAKSIQLEDVEKPDVNERQDVILYGTLTENIKPGEVVENILKSNPTAIQAPF